MTWSWGWSPIWPCCFQIVTVGVGRRCLAHCHGEGGSGGRDAVAGTHYIFHPKNKWNEKHISKVNLSFKAPFTHMAFHFASRIAAIRKSHKLWDALAIPITLNGTKLRCNFAVIVARRPTNRGIITETESLVSKRSTRTYFGCRVSYDFVCVILL